MFTNIASTPELSTNKKFFGSYLFARHLPAIGSNLQVELPTSHEGLRIFAILEIKKQNLA